MDDRDGDPVFLAESVWEMNYKSQKHDDVQFLKTKELE